jgi:putative hydrolase of the HAD superfamily
MKISAVCFDLGNVLIRVEWQRLAEQLAAKSPYEPEKIKQLLRDDPQPIAYELGQITSAKFFAHLKKLLKYKGTAKEIRTAFSEIFTPLTEHIALAAMLSRHYPLAILSNTNEAHIAHAESAYSFFSLFPTRVYSYDIKAMKPHVDFYQAAHAALGAVDPLEILFIDDLEANILAASKLGWQTIHLRPDVNLRDALASYELLGLD